jgi:hypothetical protein
MFTLNCEQLIKCNTCKLCIHAEAQRGELYHCWGGGGGIICAHSCIFNCQVL